MLQLPWRQTPLTPAEEANLFMLMLEDDTEEAPWMIMGDLQFWSASSFAHSLRLYAQEQGLPWYVASMLPILYQWPPSTRWRQLAPDTFVAFVEQRARTSFDATAEGGFPPFVLEVVSPSSTERDQEEKRFAYELLGVREYALFTPREGKPSQLAGYRRDAATEQFMPWPLDEAGRLWSDVLGLYLIVRGTLLQAQTADGRLLLTPEQARAAQGAAEAAQRAAEAAQRDEAAARQAAEAAQQAAEAAQQQAEREAERLRRELERYRQRGDDTA